MPRPPHSLSPRPNPSRSRRVVVTGMGLVTGLGRCRERSWEALRQGRVGFRAMEIAGGPHAGSPCEPVGQRPGELVTQAAEEAVADARLGPGSFEPTRAGTVIGLSKGDLGTLAKLHRSHRDGDAPASSLSSWLACWPDAAASSVARHHSLQGPCLAPIAACATGLVAALRGAELIREGVCDVVLAGAGDASLDPFLLGAFRQMGVLADPGPDPTRAVRPWDRNRSGFLVGEGAAIFVLEREEHALARGVLPYCELAGGALGADAYHMTGQNPDPANLAALLSRAIVSAGLQPEDIDHVNVHGTATQSNDPLECQALRMVLREHADGVSCSANKGQIGHLLGAAGAVELAFTCLALRDGFVPPTLNLDDPDPLCDLDGTPHVGRPKEIRSALKVSIGFGGHIAGAIIRRWDGPSRPPSGPPS